MRQKKTPVRRRLDKNDAGEVASEVLGRFQTRNSHSLDYMLANEIAADIKKEKGGSGAVFDTYADDEEKVDDTHRQEHNDENRYQHADSMAVRKMPPTLAAIERQIAAQERQMSRQRKKKKYPKKKKRSIKHVSFAKAVVSLPPNNLNVESEIIPPPELIIKSDRCDVDANEDGNTRLLYFCPRKHFASPIDGDDRAVLWSFNLTRTKIYMTEDETITAEKAAVVQHLVVTAIAIRDIWKQYDLPEQILTSLITCVKAEWIQLVLCTSSSSLNIVLTRRAFEGCRNLPFIQQHRQYKKYSVANCLQHIIKNLFDVAKAAPIFSKDKSMNKISAKHVYDLVDNKNIEHYEKDENKKPPILNIRGLIPSLRPYQAAAVQWMLERERMTNHGEEWKVIWTVLDSTTGGTMPLIKLKECESTNIFSLYYCPFNGRVARTIEEARQISLLGHTHPIKGGILADQMGLGKTIEVLACILAHPFPIIARNDEDTPCRRQLIFAGDSSVSGEQGKSGQSRVESVVTDREVIVDTNCSLDDDDTDGILTQAKGKFNMTSPIRLDKVKTVAVTPDKVEEQIDQRWVDDIEVGSCICGEIICFSKRLQKRKLAFCEYCEEPMHIECTCLESADVEKLQRLDLRRRFGNEILECVRCKGCPCCAMKKNASPIRSRATIIVCPPSILDQWAQEIRKHTSQMRVLVYGGVEKESKRARRHSDAIRLLHPTYLADADIILVSFAALMSDLSHSEENRFISRSDGGGWSSSNLRRRKKYRVVPSPLLSIHFWRVCIDEAQRVEVTTTKAAKMALKLKADHFWAVSGTPIGRGKLQDLYGLFLFLRLAPFDHKDWFNSCLSPTIEGLNDRIQVLLRHIFWRSTKSFESVKRQIGIPEMIEERVVLDFSSIERHFYIRQLQKTLELADNCKDTSIVRGKRKSSRLDFLSESLHRLRAACCHPQVGSSGLSGGRRQKSRKLSSGNKKDIGNSVASRVMTMEQILDRFINDARHKCEEAQRIAILHTNGMAGLMRLKTEARARGVKVDQDDRSLFVRSGQLYRESLLLAQKNASPVRASAEAILTGNAGFFPSSLTFRGGKCFPMWKMQQDVGKVWATIEYEDSSRRISKVLIRPMLNLPVDVREENSNDFKWKLVKPTSVMFQVATVATGGEFVDCVEASLDDDWVEIDNVCRVKKSKTWRIVVTTTDCCDLQADTSLQQFGYFMGLEIQLYEPQINSDDLQLLHTLHNSCLSYKAAIQISSTDSNDDIQAQVNSMQKELEQIESLHKEQTQTLHKAYKLKLSELTKKRNEKEQQLYDITCLSKSRKNVDDCWDDGWYNDFLGIVCLSSSETQQNAIFERIVQDVEGLYIADDIMKFPDFNNLHGLQTALSVRISKIRSDGLGKKQVMLPATTADNEFVQVRSARFKCGRAEHGLCMQSIHDLSSNPGYIEIDENRHCRLCKADWNQTGKVCSHCDVAGILQDLKPDSVTIAVLTAIYASIRTSSGMALLNSKQASHVAARAKYFFEVIEAEEREKIGAWRMWRVHLDLLNGLDELDSCKKGLRLSFDNEDLTSYTEDQLNAIVQPIDVLSQYHDHATKQAMSLSDLRQSTGTLRYLQNQKQSLDDQEESTPDACVVCLLPLDEECCVLRCGHRFHRTPCFDQILKNSSAINVHCPMKCRVQTARNEVMIATNKASNDGSNTTRAIKGSYGTKITRIVSDILCIKDKGEKGIIFSQWHDMLDILESALTENNIGIARPYGGNRFSESLLAFRSPECTVLLLNLKQGAEGLTLVHATHVFMVEPVMNNGLDQQAINRIHRIGQTRQTVVWRYLIKDTIEMKIDIMRRKQGDDEVLLEDSMHSTKLNSIFSAGGMDGGFATQAELLQILD
jgi:SNF2 family DNA or RNA helicase